MKKVMVAVFAVVMALAVAISACATHVGCESDMRFPELSVARTETIVVDGFSFYIDTLDNGATGVRVDASITGEALQSQEFEMALTKVADLTRQRGSSSSVLKSAGDYEEYAKTGSKAAGSGTVYAYHWGYFEKPQFEWRFKVSNQGQVYCTGLSSYPNELRLSENIAWDILGGVGTISWPPGLSFSGTTTNANWVDGSVTGYYLYNGAQREFSAVPSLSATRVRVTIGEEGYIRIANSGYAATVSSAHTYVFP